MRVQTLVVVALATCVEYTFSPLLQAYTYRIGTVPLFVPPGHGLVYLAALTLGRSALVGRYRRPLVARDRARRRRLGGGRRAGARRQARRPRRLLVRLPAGIPGLGTEPRRSTSARSSSCPTWSCRDGARDLALGAHGPRTARHRPGEPAVRRGRRLRLVRPVGAAARAVAAGPVAIVRCARGRRLRTPTALSTASCSSPFVARAGAERTVVPLQRGEPAAGLDDDGHERGHVVELEGGLRGDVHRALRDEHVRPEVAVGPDCARPALEREELLAPAGALPLAQVGVRQRGVGQVPDRRRREDGGRRRGCGRSRRRCRGRPTTGARGRGPRRRRPRARGRRAARAASPRPARRGRSSSCRRWGPPPTAGSRGRSARTPRRRRRRACGCAAAGSRTSSSAALSASLTGVRSGLVSTRRSAAWYRDVVSASTMSAMTCARRRSSSYVVTVAPSSWRSCPGASGHAPRPNGTGLDSASCSTRSPDLPVHILVVHAVVVLLPLMAVVTSRSPSGAGGGRRAVGRARGRRRRRAQLRRQGVRRGAADPAVPGRPRRRPAARGAGPACCGTSRSGCWWRPCSSG